MISMDGGSSTSSSTSPSPSEDTLKGNGAVVGIVVVPSEGASQSASAVEVSAGGSPASSANLAIIIPAVAGRTGFCAEDVFRVGSGFCADDVLRVFPSFVYESVFLPPIHCC